MRVPVPVVVGSLPGRSGWPFTAYHRIPGGPLDWNHLGPAARDRLARDLGRILLALARFPLGLTKGIDLPGGGPALWRARHEAELRKCRKVGYRLMSSRLQDAVERLFTSHLDDDRNFRWRTVLLHSEVHPGHVLVEDGRVTGLIDWGYAQLGDPARELAWWASHFGSAGLWQLAHGRVGADDPTFFDRVTTYRSLIPIYHLLGGLEFGDRRMVSSGLAALRASFRPLAA